MRVTTTLDDGFEIVRIGVRKIVIEETPISVPYVERQSLIERVNQILDQYEPQDARPI